MTDALPTFAGIRFASDDTTPEPAHTAATRGEMFMADCPSLKRKPSEYMREMFYSTQPMETPDDPSILEATFRMINAETQLVWSSDYPLWDFDLPSVIYDLPFLKEGAKRNILGGNAARLFGLDTKPVKRIQ